MEYPPAGGKGFDNYSWHTDLPTGHPMVTGQQTVEFDLHAVEHCRTLVVWGMNWITTKMPDAHWLTEGRLKGTRVVVIACEYSATATKGDDVVVVRPGTTPALALGLTNVTLREKLYDAEYVRRWTDLPILVRMDTLQYLSAADVFGTGPAELSNQTKVLAEGDNGPPPGKQTDMLIPTKLRQEWGDYVWWDGVASKPAALTRDQVGEKSTVGDALLEGTVEVTPADGKTVSCRPASDLVKEYAAHFDPATVEEMYLGPGRRRRVPGAAFRPGAGLRSSLEVGSTAGVCVVAAATSLGCRASSRASAAERTGVGAAVVAGVRGGG